MERILIQNKNLILHPIRKKNLNLIKLYAGDISVSGPTRSTPHPHLQGATEAFIEHAENSVGTEDVWIIGGLSSGLTEVLLSL